MTRRTRKFIIDNTTGTVYSNIDNPALATKVNVSAGLVPKIIKVSPVKAGKPIVKVVSNKAIVQKKNLVIKENSDALKYWIKPPATIYRKFYMFHVLFIK
jgi:hypothetical protein